uniref:Uncharacterized protein n=1 Tax=Anguilla anguilla TaxID=7936 RepID=A0A0E9URI5_ANGAN
MLFCCLRILLPDLSRVSVRNGPLFSMTSKGQ